MARFFLALLALLFGLAVSGTPTQARVCAAGEAEVGAVAVAVAGPRQAISAAPRPAWSIHRDRLDAQTRSLPAPLTAPPVPAVLQGIDRARE